MNEAKLQEAILNINGANLEQPGVDERLIHFFSENEKKDERPALLKDPGTPIESLEPIFGGDPFPVINRGHKLLKRYDDNKKRGIKVGDKTQSEKIWEFVYNELAQQYGLNLDYVPKEDYRSSLLALIEDLPEDNAEEMVAHFLKIQEYVSWCLDQEKMKVREKIEARMRPLQDDLKNLERVLARYK
jgi:hypothetical protein